MWDATLSYLRRHSQATAFVVGLLLAVGAAVAWYYNRIGSIRGSLLIGIGSSVIAAAIVAYLSPFSESAYRRFISLGIEKVWPSREAVGKREWVDWLSQANYTCTLLGIAHNNWCKDKRFPSALADRLEHGVRVKILFLDPNASAAQLRAHEEEGKRDTRDAIRESIKFIWEFRQRLEAGIRDRLRVYVYDATPSCGLTWIDDFMIVTHYLAGLPNLTSPALLVKPAQIGMGHSLYDIYAENVQNIEKAGTGTELDDKNIQRFLPPGPQKEVANLVQQGPDRVPPDDQERAEGGVGTDVH